VERGGGGVGAVEHSQSRVEGGKTREERVEDRHVPNV